MNKGLEAYNELKEEHWFDFADRYFFINPQLKMNLNIIENALKENKERIEELEETNHLMFIREHKNTKKLKALEIIKEKGVNIQELKFSYSVNEYNICKGNENETLTQEEYDLLKEVLL